MKFRTIVALVAYLGLTVSSVYADVTSSASVEVVGTVDLGTGGTGGDSLVVTVPTALYFAITPNAGELVNSVSDIITNESSSAVNVDFIGYEADNNNDCKVIAHDTYTDEEWLELGQIDTESKIGLGLKCDSGTFWSPAGINSSTVGSSGSFRVEKDSSKQVEVAVKCGRAWSANKVLYYTLHLVLSKV